jgi:sphinganine-1-phosphate aldolase
VGRGPFTFFFLCSFYSHAAFPPRAPPAGLPASSVEALLVRYSEKDGHTSATGKVRRGALAHPFPSSLHTAPAHPPLLPPPLPQVSGAIYHGGADLQALQVEAFRRYTFSNPLHPDLFPRLRKMESEVVAMCVAAFRGPPGACGTVTSGGTESILMACKAYRDLARAQGVTEPELVAPATAHAAFDKAAAYFGIKLVSVPVDPATFRADVRATARAMGRNTIALVGSAPSYPQGVVDPIPELAALALAAGVPLHVDACLGSLLIPFAAEAGFPQPCAFDFSVPGVTSISMDTHKFGFAPKGSSVVMYRTHALRAHQYFVAPEWTGGIYASPSIAGSRPGALVAGAWATLLRMGRGGYLEAARVTLAAAARVAEGVRGLAPHLVLLGQPTVSVVCFSTAPGSPLSIYHVNDAMQARGWNLNTMQNPAALHICVTFANAPHAGTFVEDLRAAVEEVRTAPPGRFKGGSGAIYGLAATVPDKSVVTDFAHMFLNALNAPKKGLPV